MCVAFQVGGKYVLFQDNGVLLLDHDSYYPIEPGTWLLTDSSAGYWQPCEAFLAACTSGDAWIVQTTSPLSDNWKWSEDRNAIVHWMEVFSLDEMVALG